MNASRSGFVVALGSLRPGPSVVGIYSVASVVGALISLASASGGVWAKASVTALATAVALVMLVGASAMPWVKLSSRPIATALLFAALAAFVGAVRGIVFVQVAPMLGVALVSDDLAQIVNSVVSAVVWLTLAGLVMGGRDRYRRRYRALLLQGETQTDWDSHPSVTQVKSSLRQALARAGESSDRELNEVADAIRHEIETNIRPLSHRLWFGVQDEEPRSRFIPLMRDSLAVWSVPVGFVSVVWFTTAIIGGARWIGLERAFVAVVASTVLLIVLVIAIGKWTPGSPWLRGSALIGGSVVVVIASDGVARALGYESRLYADIGLIVLLPITITAFVATAAAISLAAADRRMVLEVAERESREIVERRRQSTFLHNSFQSELTGMALQLDEAARSGSTDEAREALERVHALLARSISQDFADFHEDPRMRVDRVIAGWRGICDVSIDLVGSCLDDPRLVLGVQAMEEIIANAVRHGRASTVRICVESTPEGLVIVCESDAHIVSRSEPHRTGLGSQVLEAMTSQEVEFESTATGSRLSLVLP